MLVFIEKNGGWVIPPPKIAEWVVAGAGLGRIHRLTVRISAHNETGWRLLNLV